MQIIPTICTNYLPGGERGECLDTQPMIQHSSKNICLRSAPLIENDSKDDKQRYKKMPTDKVSPG